VGLFVENRNMHPKRGGYTPKCEDYAPKREGYTPNAPKREG